MSTYFIPLTLFLQLAGERVTIQGPPGPPGPPGPKGEVKNLLSFIGGDLTHPSMVETKGWNNPVFWELELHSPLPFQAKQDQSNRIAVSTRHLTRPQRAQASCHGLFLMLFPNKLSFQNSYCKGWIVTSLTT